MKVGDLVRLKDGKQTMGLFLEWATFDEETNPYTCPLIWWQDEKKPMGKVSTVQTSLIEVISA